MGWGGQRRWDWKEEAPEMQSWGHLCLQLSLRCPLWTRHLPGWWAGASSLYSVLSWVAVLLRGWHSGQLGSRQGTQSGQRPCPWLGWGRKAPWKTTARPDIQGGDEEGGLQESEHVLIQPFCLTSMPFRLPFSGPGAEVLPMDSRGQQVPSSKASTWPSPINSDEIVHVFSHFEKKSWCSCCIRVLVFLTSQTSFDSFIVENWDHQK